MDTQGTRRKSSWQVNHLIKNWVVINRLCKTNALPVDSMSWDKSSRQYTPEIMRNVYLLKQLHFEIGQVKTFQECQNCNFSYKKTDKVSEDSN